MSAAPLRTVCFGLHEWRNLFSSITVLIPESRRPCACPVQGVILRHSGMCNKKPVHCSPCSIRNPDSPEMIHAVRRSHGSALPDITGNHLNEYTPIFMGMFASVGYSDFPARTRPHDPGYNPELPSACRQGLFFCEQVDIQPGHGFPKAPAGVCNDCGVSIVAHGLDNGSCPEGRVL
jgi:hypothetical protein